MKIVIFALILMLVCIICGCSTDEAVLKPKPTIPTQQDIPQPSSEQMVAESPTDVEVEVAEEPNGKSEAQSIKQTEPYSIKSLTIDVWNIKESIIDFLGFEFPVRNTIIMSEKPVRSENYEIPHTYTSSETGVTRINVQPLYFTGTIMCSLLPCDNILKSRIHTENAASLLENEPRPLGRDEVIKELKDAKSLLINQLDCTYEWQKEDLEWLNKSKDPEVQTEKAKTGITQMYDEYRGELSTIVEELTLALTGLSNIKIEYTEEEYQRLFVEREKRRLQLEELQKSINEYLKLTEEYEDKAELERKLADDIISEARSLLATDANLDYWRIKEKAEQEAQEHYAKANEYEKQSAHYRELARQVEQNRQILNH